VSRRLRCSAVNAALLLLGVGCSSPSHPPGYSGSTTVTPPREAGCSTEPDPWTAPPGPDAEGLCGNEFLPAVGDAPNIYFVIDRSGSMREVVDGLEKYASVAKATVDLVRKIGSRANFGAAVFPAPEAAGDPSSCLTGREVFSTRAGDTPGTTTCSGDGPVTAGFAGATSLPSRVTPAGGTPTAATLWGLVDTLAALPGRTAVVLATDGGPNCNEAAVCDAAHCIPNIERAPSCDLGTNCCAGDAGFTSTMCLDQDPTKRAVAELLQHGISTYVIGIPGSAPYRALLDELAVAGGTARAGDPAYYDVQSLTELDEVLSSIGATVLLSCHLTLQHAPPDPSEVRVFLDKMRLTYDSPDGWSFGGRADAGSAGASGTGADAVDAGGANLVTIELLGRACSDLLSGRIREVQVVSGCPADIPR
jgi:hypothetical protein